MQLLQQALPLAAKDDNKSDVSLFYMFFAETLLNHRGVYEAWRLQSLTNLAELPDYDEGYYGYREYNGAPVDAEGKPVYHTTPKKWDTAETDGQRWRWLLEQTAENNPQMKDQVRMHFAQFMEQLFGVHTMAQGRFGRGFGFGGASDDDTKKNESGTYDLHTLKDEETIAKLASGIKRFKLPDEFNSIKIYQQVAVDEPYADVHADTLPQRPTLVGVVGGLEPSALEELISRMADRAEANQPSDRPSMLSTDLQRTDRP